MTTNTRSPSQWSSIRKIFLSRLKSIFTNPFLWWYFLVVIVFFSGSGIFISFIDSEGTLIARIANQYQNIITYCIAITFAAYFDFSLKNTTILDPFIYKSKKSKDLADIMSARNANWIIVTTLSIPIFIISIYLAYNYPYSWAALTFNLFTCWLVWFYVNTDNISYKISFRPEDFLGGDKDKIKQPEKITPPEAPPPPRI